MNLALKAVPTAWVINPTQPFTQAYPILLLDFTHLLISYRMDKGTEMNLTGGNVNVEKVVEKKASLLDKKSNFRSQYSFGT